MAQQSYLIKILSGSNAGGEIELFSSSILIGNTDDCDIILGDPFLEERKFSVEIFEDYATIERGELPFYLDGESIEEHSFNAPFYRVITVASTSFVIGESDTVWPDITLPEIFREKNTEEPPTNQEVSQEENDTLTESDDDETLGLDENEENPSNKEDVAAAKSKKKKRLIILSSIVLIFLLVGLGIFGTLHFLKGPNFASKEYLKDLNELLQKSGYNFIRIGIRKPDLLILTGFAKDKKSVDALENLVYKKAPKILILVKYLEQVIQEIEQRFAAKKIFVKLRYTPATNTLMFTGYIKNKEVQAELEKSIAPLLTPFKNVFWKIVYWMQIAPELKNDWTERRLYDYLKATPHNFTIHIDGQLTPQERISWEEGKGALLTQFGLSSKVITESIADLRSRKAENPTGAQLGETKNTSSVLGNGLHQILGIEEKTPPSAKLVDLPEGVDFNEVMQKDPCKYISINEGEILFVRINGEQGLYSIGSMLPGGFTIKDILENTIILEDEQGSFTFCPQTIEP